MKKTMEQHKNWLAEAQAAFVKDFHELEKKFEGIQKEIAKKEKKDEIEKMRENGETDFFALLRAIWEANPAAEVSCEYWEDDELTEDYCFYVKNWLWNYPNNEINIMAIERFENTRCKEFSSIRIEYEDKLPVRAYFIYEE